MTSRQEVHRHVTLETGPRLHYVEYGSPGGEPVVFVHGWPDSWFSYSRVLPRLPEHIRALAIDQRGFGESDRPETGYTIPELASDVIAFLDALAIERATLVGHSFGSFVARQAALAQPRRITGLVLIGTGFATTTPNMQELQRMLLHLPDPIPREFAREFAASTVFHPVPPEFFERIVDESMKLPPRLWRRTIDALVAYDGTRELARLGPPTLLLWGDHDALFSRAEQDQFRAALPAARMTVYEDTGHCPNWERPEQVVRDLVTFLGARGVRDQLAAM